MPRHIRAAGAPNRLAFTLGYPPFVAVSVGDKYLLTFDTTRTHEDLGLTFPEDYGAIAGFRWMANNVLLVALMNGCADRPNAMLCCAGLRSAACRVDASSGAVSLPGTW